MTTASNDIIALLDQQKQLLDELLLSLRQEIAALANRDIAALENILALKTTQLQQLQQNDALLAACADIAEQKQQAWFKQKVAELDAQLEECKRQNDINQQTLEQSQLTLARFKTELLASRGKSGLTYTSKGKPAVESKGKGIKA
ncbi:flagella synthesis protein FlgN [Rheinheimera pacifica]|uniref:Flagella synthesis protein FlgN n=1 Tax=Rheinheimera pacifica TaxID=173990 RepID=A0A1H6MQI3_9GAMM|nr:flagellar export chaperone FlgN [Rheinheimera pacifica]SEI00001.1 flagella synthesis protein FlgN [Rheinheimera pacifica]